MNWFTGPISNAITESQTKKLIFLVYTTDAIVNEMNDLWNDETISSLCTDNCVCLRLEADSEPCNQFKQIYPITVYPTTYLIGNNGAAIETVSGLVDKESLEVKIKNAIQVHNSAKTSAATASSFNSDDQTSEDHKKKLDERVALAKEKLRQIQEKKRLEEEEKEKLQEIERRKMGQEIIKSKKDIEDQEMKRIAEQKKQEKIDDMLAKQRIKERIQQDREEKQQRYAKEKEEIDKAKEEARAQQELVRQQEKLNEAAIRSQVARIQFKLVDGSSVINQFDPNQILSEARMFITDKLKEMNETQHFSMHSTFPKRDYTESDMEMSLRDLQLAPSATILIIPIRSKASKALSSFMPATSSTSSGAASSSSNSIVTYANDLIGFLFLPFTIIYGLITSLIGIGGNSSASATNSANVNRNSSSTVQSNQPVHDNIRLRNLRRNLGGVTGSNVRSLHQNNDRDDDENATWNGNSTQQM